MGIRREMIEKGMGIVTEKKEMIVGRVKLGKQKWKIVGVYIKGNMRECCRG